MYLFSFCCLKLLTLHSSALWVDWVSAMYLNVSIYKRSASCFHLPSLGAYWFLWLSGCCWEEELMWVGIWLTPRVSICTGMSWKLVSSGRLADPRGAGRQPLCGWFRRNLRLFLYPIGLKFLGSNAKTTFMFYLWFSKILGLC